MVVFKYIEDKDVFQTFYSKGLAKRLVNAMSTSDDAESSMISKLKDTCGYDYTSKLQRMFTDIGISKDLNEQFKAHQQNQVASSRHADFSVMVLATGSWPMTAPTMPFTVPHEVQVCTQHFENFYNAKHNGRKLTWLYNLSKAELKAHYCRSSKAGYTFQVSTYQMGILLGFNRALSMTYDEILGTTGLEEGYLKGNLALFCKARVLKLDDATSTYTLNVDYKR